MSASGHTIASEVGRAGGSPSDLLHDAAVLMRRRAQMAAGSIDAVLDDILGDDATGLDGTWDEMVTSLRTLEGSPGDHIASWHPAVALAVADWLADQAVDVAAHASHHAAGDPLYATPAEQVARFSSAFAVARAYLGCES